MQMIWDMAIWNVMELKMYKLLMLTVWHPKAFAFSAILYLHPVQLSLRSAYLHWQERYRLTKFRIDDNEWVRICHFADSLCPCNPTSERISQLHPFWVEPSIFWLFSCYDVY